MSDPLRASPMTAISAEEVDPRAWREIAAKMIEAKHVAVTGASSDDEFHAADFIFTEGVFFWPREQQIELVSVLREPYGALSQSGEQK